MEHSLEDALLILDKWRKESIVIGIVTYVANLEIHMMGTLVAADRERVAISCGKDNHFVIRLNDCVFQYGDPREFPEIPPPPGGHTYAAFLVIQYPPKELVLLFEPVTD